MRLARQAPQPAPLTPTAPCTAFRAKSAHCTQRQILYLPKTQHFCHLECLCNTKPRDVGRLQLGDEHRCHRSRDRAVVPHRQANAAADLGPIRCRCDARRAIVRALKVQSQPSMVPHTHRLPSGGRAVVSSRAGGVLRYRRIESSQACGAAATRVHALRDIIRTSPGVMPWALRKTR